MTNQQKFEIARNYAQGLRRMHPDPLAIFLAGCVAEDKTDPHGKIEIVIVNPLSSDRSRLKYLAENLASQMSVYYGVMIEVAFRNTTPPPSYSKKMIGI